MNLGTPVTLRDIEPTLKQLWEADHARTNASLINFAIYTEDPQALEKNSVLIQKLTQEHACRALLLAVDREARDTSIQSWVTAHCHLSQGQKSVCCEQLSFLLNGITPGRLNNTLFAHLQSDLPLVLWWQGELTSVFRESLYTKLNNLIVDGLEWNDSIQNYAKLKEAMLATASQQSLTIQDLAWSRTWSFRQALAALFNEPLAINALTHIQTVYLSTTKETTLVAQWFLAWLCYHAVWTFEKKEGSAYYLRNEQGQLITVQLSSKNPRNNEEATTTLNHIELCSPDTTICVHHPLGDHAHLCQELFHQGQLVLKQTFSLDPIENQEQVLAQQLSRGGKNSAYRTLFDRFHQLLTA